jgi:hypothetical protein
MTKDDLQLQPVKAPHGQKMIELRIRLWTDDIAPQKGYVVPKHAWDGGVVLVDRNDAHDLHPKDPIPFNGFSELPRAIEKALVSNGIKIHLSRRQRKYVV